jgi:Ser-tRNA(Ala) deacylase AlaX
VTTREDKQKNNRKEKVEGKADERKRWCCVMKMHTSEERATARCGRKFGGSKKTVGGRKSEELRLV